MPSNRSLSRHLLRAALLATLRPLLTMVGLGLWHYRKDFTNVEAFSGSESLSSARVVATFLDFLVDDTRTLLLRIARETEQGALNREKLISESQIQLQTEGLEVTDAHGIIRLSSINGNGRDTSDLPYFQAVKAGAPVAYSDVFYSKYLRQNVVMIAVPYQRDGAFAGAVMARLNLKMLNELLSARLDDPRLRNTYVTDRQGQLISHHDFRWVEEGRRLFDAPPVKWALSGGSGWIKYHSEADEEERISGYVAMPGTGWAVVSTRQPGDSILRVGERFQHQLILALLAGLVVGTGALLWGRRLARPLEVLETTLRGAQGPGFKTSLVPTLEEARITTEVTEYGTLVAGYNSMALELNERFEAIMALQQELESKNRTLLTQNEELIVLSAQAQASNKLKSEFLANMSHELRTPLNSIIGYTELVLTEDTLELDPVSRRNLEIVLKNARNLLALINDILDLSKIESGKTSLFVEAFDPLVTLQGILNTTEPLARAKGLQLHVEADPALERVETDETKFRQIVLNLVSNAIKFTREGSVTIRLEAKDGDRWIVRVSDTGMGILPEHQEMVFEEFRQVDASATRQVGGTGLGLSIARKLTRLLGGDLTLESEFGKGSTFTLTLTHPQSQIGVPLPEPTSAAMPSVEVAERIVLAIDDDPQALHLVTEKLRGASYQVVPINSGDLGLQLARELRPYAITLDVKLRRDDDWSILRALKDDPQTAGIPVIILSFEENRALATSLGAAACLVKPIDRDQLLRALEGITPLPPVALEKET